MDRTSDVIDGKNRVTLTVIIIAIETKTMPMPQIRLMLWFSMVRTAGSKRNARRIETMNVSNRDFMMTKSVTINPNAKRTESHLSDREKKCLFKWTTIV